ncbi:MAG: DNA alkylation repair protein [Alistipes sp.]
MDDTQRMIGLLRRLKVEMNGAVVDAMRSRGLYYPLSYGVSVPTIREIAKAYAPAHAFALFLFRQQIRELKLAAAFIDDPSEVTVAQMREWADGLTNTELVEQVVGALFRHAPDAPDMAWEWMGSPEPMKRYAGLLTAVGDPRGKEPRMGRPFSNRRIGSPGRVIRRFSAGGL